MRRRSMRCFRTLCDWCWRWTWCWRIGILIPARLCTPRRGNIVSRSGCRSSNETDCGVCDHRGSSCSETGDIGSKSNQSTGGAVWDQGSMGHDGRVKKNLDPRSPAPSRQNFGRSRSKRKKMYQIATIYTHIYKYYNITCPQDTNFQFYYTPRDRRRITSGRINTTDENTSITYPQLMPKVSRYVIESL